MTLRRFLLGLFVLSISFVAIATETYAKDRGRLKRSQYAKSNNLEETKKLKLPSKQLRVPGSSITLSKHKLERLMKAAGKRCGCVSPQDETEFSRGCVKSCVARYVGWSTVLACGMACSGNWPACAVCVGVHEWVVLGCVQYCVWSDVFSLVDDFVSKNRERRPNKVQAKSLG